MGKRVLLQKGTSPILFVAPHANQDDDLNTDIITDVLAVEMGAYSVRNVGWRRAENAVLGEGIANLNSIKHCKLDPCKKEFLDPLVDFKNECINKFGGCNVFYIHGMSNKIRQKTQVNVDLVIGYGAGNPPSYTCTIPYKNALITRLREETFNVYQGKAGGIFSAWNTDNLTQLFRQHILDERVQGVQIEIVNLRRYNETVSIDTALYMARALDRFLYGKTPFPKNMIVREY